jgi:hypothetical protein
MNNKGQFSIIAALLVAVVLVAAVATTYSAIRYSGSQDQPQILSAIDETNLGIKEILGFTVGYYGSVLKVTGNMTYAQELAKNYTDSGFKSLQNIHPEWNMIFNPPDLTLNADWFSNQSYSKGNMTVNYNLEGLGIYGVSYSATVRLDVKILDSGMSNQTQLAILRDESEPLINLGKNNLKIYSYDYETSTWNLTAPLSIASYVNGTYILDLPQNVTSNAYTIEVSDTRGLMVLASSFTQFTTSLTWNSTGFREGFFDYVDEAIDVLGAHSNFAAQQSGPDGVYDTLTEQTTGTVAVDKPPSTYTALGSTSIVGALADLYSDNSVYMSLKSYRYNTITLDNKNSTTLTSSATSMSWTHTTGTGNDRILLVSVDVFSPSGTPNNVSGVTYGGVALTLVKTDLYNTNPRVRSYVFNLTNPTSGTNTISVTFSATTSTAVGGSVSYDNVNQATPVLASNSTTGYGSIQTVNLITSGNYSKVIFGHLGTYRTSNPTPYYVNQPVEQVNVWNQTAQTYKGFGSSKIVTNGTVALSWNTSGAVSWVAILLLLDPTPAYYCGAEFTGISNLETWNNIAWTIDASVTIGTVSVTYQLYNYRTGYTDSGEGYLADILGTSDNTKTQTIDTNLSDFRDASGNWKIKVTASANTQFDLKLDLMKYSINQTNYVLNLEEQWLNVNASNVRQDLCIKTGSKTTTENLTVQVWQGGSWKYLMTLLPNYFNNASLVPYIDSSTLKIRFVGDNEDVDSTRSTWEIDCVYIKDQPDIQYLINRQQSTFTVELLQNGTMRWLGQNMEVTTQTIPIPPIAVKSIHVNQTINGVNQEVPFQIEDWASNYQIPLGLTNNATVFSNRQMIVFQLNSSTTDFTIWWNGIDASNQTAMAYTNRYFNDVGSTLNNGKLRLQLAANGFVLTSTVGTTTSTSYLMRINGQNDNGNPEYSYVITNGIVRDVVLGEAEYSGGITNCSNTYTSLVITLPAGVTYYTYQARFMFQETSRVRNISDLCPVRVNTTISSPQIQTENGTRASFPVLDNSTATFLNYTSSGWTPHHFSQLINGTRGTGIIFTDTANQKLYSFNSFSGSTSKGAIRTSSNLIELLPVSSSLVAFNYSYDITWVGAVATFDGTTPVCGLYDGTTPMGLWILAEYPPTLTVTPKS